eukprot:XP_011611373.1 PREDICTED: UPF0193 protein EVG1 [Takifugu rubripes]
MMQESRLTHLQKRRITDCLQSRFALLFLVFLYIKALKMHLLMVKRRPSARPQRRSAEACRRGDAYVRERFCPGPTRDVEKEKRRLQNIMSTGQEEPAPVSSGRGPDPDTGGGDRFQEARFSFAVLGEIEERRRFLADMASLGQGKKYINIITTEISQVKPSPPTPGFLSGAVKPPLFRLLKLRSHRKSKNWRCWRKEAVSRRMQQNLRRGTTTEPTSDVQFIKNLLEAGT